MERCRRRLPTTPKHLSVTTEAGPRRDDIGGDLTRQWGMHLVDANVAMGDLVTLVEQQSATFGG